MTFTSYFANLKKIPNNIIKVSIALKSPYWFTGYVLPELAPTEEIFKKWMNRENEPYSEEDYMLEYRRDVLSKLDPHIIYDKLMIYSKKCSVVLLCYERSGSFCHRHIVAEWFEENGIKCQEYIAMGDIVMTDLNILECSTKGDRRFSAFYASVNICGKIDIIENHYQNCKRFIDPSIIKPKGVYPDYIEIRNTRFDKKYLNAWYKILWIKYLDSHPELVKYASTFDDFHDIFKGHSTINCQADVIRQYIKEGRQSILSDDLVKDLLSALSTIKNELKPINW